MSSNTNDAFLVIPQEKWLKKSTITFFKRNAATMMAPQVIHVASDEILRTMAATFEVVSRDCHYINIAARIILADRVSRKVYQEEKLFKAETDIARQFERAHDHFDQRIAQAEEKIRLGGGDPDAIPGSPQAYGARCSTRSAKDYLELLKKADLYLVLVDYLWIMGELSDTQTEAQAARLNIHRETRSQLLSIPTKTTAQFQLIHRICKGAMEQREAARAEQSAKDKARHLEQKQRLLEQQAELKALNALCDAPEAVVPA